MLLLQVSQWTIIRQLHWRVKYLFNYSCFDNVPDWHFNSTTVCCSTIQYGLPYLYNNSIRFTVFIQQFNTVYRVYTTIQYGLPCLYNNSIRFTVFIQQFNTVYRVYNILQKQSTPTLLTLAVSLVWRNTHTSRTWRSWNYIATHIQKKERNIQWISIWIYTYTFNSMTILSLKQKSKINVL